MTAASCLVSLCLLAQPTDAGGSDYGRGYDFGPAADGDADADTPRDTPTDDPAAVARLESLLRPFRGDGSYRSREGDRDPVRISQRLIDGELAIRRTEFDDDRQTRRGPPVLYRDGRAFEMPEDGPAIDVTPLTSFSDLVHFDRTLPGHRIDAMRNGPIAIRFADAIPPLAASTELSRPPDATGPVIAVQRIDDGFNRILRVHAAPDGKGGERLAGLDEVWKRHDSETYEPYFGKPQTFGPFSPAVDPIESFAIPDPAKTLQAGSYTGYVDLCEQLRGKDVETNLGSLLFDSLFTYDAERDPFPLGDAADGPYAAGSGETEADRRRRIAKQLQQRVHSLRWDFIRPADEVIRKAAGGLALPPGPVTPAAVRTAVNKRVHVIRLYTLGVMIAVGLLVGVFLIVMRRRGVT